MKKYDYLIVRSGLCGAVFAYEATKRGKRCLVIDRRDHIGGNVYTKEIEGINVHLYGAHIIHTGSKKVWDYFHQFTDVNHFVNSPIANYNGEIYNLPFNMNTFSRLWGIRTPDEAKAIINKQRSVIKGEPKTLEEQAISMAGTDIYEKLIKGYTEKQWGRPCRELPSFIIKRIPMRFTYDNNYFDIRYQGVPYGGYTPIFEKMLQDCDVILNVDFNEDQQKYRDMADKVFYTGMVDAYFDYQLGKLQYRSLRFEHEVLDTDNYQGVAVVNYTDAKTPYTRLIEHKHFEFGTQEKTVISREYPSEWDGKTEAYYPINDEENQNLYEKYAELVAKEENTIFCGRLAQYRYYDMSQAIEASLVEVEKEFGN